MSGTFPKHSFMKYNQVPHTHTSKTEFRGFSGREEYIIQMFTHSLVFCTKGDGALSDVEFLGFKAQSFTHQTPWILRQHHIFRIYINKRR